MEHPISTTYLDKVIARALAALPAAGAWDGDPTALHCEDFHFVTFYLAYMSGNDGQDPVDGAVDFKIEVSPDTSGSVWHQFTEYAPAVLAAGVDSQSRIQREYITYEPTQDAAFEYFVYGAIELRGTIERIRIVARESGDTDHPGQLSVVAVFSS